MNLILVCRQVHQEAGLVFYTSNHFYFHSIQSLKWFAENLAPPQLRAVRSIRICVDESHGSRFAFMARSALKYLTGVRYLAVSYKVEMVWYSPSADPTDVSSYFDCKWRFRKLWNLMDLKADKVEITPVF